ncbi:MAG: porin family protein [Saprospiraceae bacterium]|nr:PorT family protein [Lewinella sp.]
MKKSTLPLLLLLGCIIILKGQPMDDEYFYGFKAGANYYTIDGIQTTIIPEVFSVSTYSTETRPRIGFVGGLYFYHRFPRSRTAVQPEILFAEQGGDFNYTDINDLDYTISFKYQYVNLGVLCKVYPFSGFHFAAGPQVGFNVANTNIDYHSNMPDLGVDLQVQQHLREVLKGETDINVNLGLGYDFDFGLCIEARYSLGVKDVIETLANGYGFIENTNTTKGYQVTVGWIIPFEPY